MRQLKQSIEQITGQAILFGLISIIGLTTLAAIATIYGASWLILSAAKLGGCEDEP